MATKKKAAVKNKLTAKQRAFVEAYAGNAVEAARIAGYSGSYSVLGVVGAENLKKPKIAEAIQNRENKQSRHRIATREERQQFWSDTMNDDNETMKERLKASELLGKSNADFTDKVLVGSLEEELKRMTDEELLEQAGNLDSRAEMLRHPQGTA